MDQGTLVESQIVDGRRFLERFAADGHLVRAAFWAKSDETGRWQLFVASELAEAGHSDAFGAARRSLAQLGETWLNHSHVRIVPPGDRLAAAVLHSVDQFPAAVGQRSSGSALYSLGYDPTYIYPPRVFTLDPVDPMTREDLGREIVRLMDRDAGVVQPSRVTLKDGTAFSGVPFGLQLGTQRAMLAQFIADGEPAPRVVRLDEIASIA